MYLRAGKVYNGGLQVSTKETYISNQEGLVYGVDGKKPRQIWLEVRKCTGMGGDANYRYDPKLKRRI